MNAPMVRTQPHKRTHLQPQPSVLPLQTWRRWWWWWQRRLQQQQQQQQPRGAVAAPVSESIQWFVDAHIQEK
jgi:hypothetical protein